ncbi:MAG: hypothetical protein L6R28_10565 [Planctomycetes bacterium]|nr:hypothetical protein [Planctomycetota bacterium]
MSDAPVPPVPTDPARPAPPAPANVPHEPEGGQPSLPSSTDSARLPRSLKHPQVATAAVVFCLGLLVVRMAFGFLQPQQLQSLRGLWHDPLLSLVVVASAGTLFFLMLRNEEGDFNALFLVATGLFAVQEALSYLWAAYGLGEFQTLGIPVLFSSCVYAMLALVAHMYDPLVLRTSRNRRLLAVAAFAMLGAGVLRAGEVLRAKDMLQSESTRLYLAYGGIAALAAALLYLSYGMTQSLREDRRRVSAAYQAARTARDPAPPASTAGGSPPRLPDAAEELTKQPDTN